MIWKVILSTAAAIAWDMFAAWNIDLIPNIDWLSLPLFALTLVIMPGLVWWGVAKLTRLL